MGGWKLKLKTGSLREARSGGVLCGRNKSHLKHKGRRKHSALMLNFKKVLSDCTQPVDSEFCSSREAHGNQYEAHGNQYDVPSLLTALMDIKEK